MASAAAPRDSAHAAGTVQPGAVSCNGRHTYQTASSGARCLLVITIALCLSVCNAFTAPAFMPISSTCKSDQPGRSEVRAAHGRGVSLDQHVIPRASLRGPTYSQPYASRTGCLLCAETTSAEHPGAAIITGGTGGIGFAVAKKLAARGYNLVLGYGADSNRAQSACEELQEDFGVRAVTIGGDLTTEESRDETIARIFEAVDSDFDGKLCAFVHAAGFFHERLLEHHFDGAVANFTVYDAYQSIYPKAFVALTEGCLQRMADKQGRIVCVSNPGCNTLQAPRVGYDMPGQGKATMEYIVRIYALRLAKRGLTINAVSPGYTDTKEWDKARRQMGGGDIEAGRRVLDERVLSRSPMKRWAHPDEIAQTIDFLCAEQSGLITGAFIPVDGGLHLA